MSSSSSFTRRTSVTLDAKQILALSPDPASAKARSQLAVAHQWSNLGKSEAAL